MNMYLSIEICVEIIENYLNEQYNGDIVFNYEKSLFFPYCVLVARKDLRQEAIGIGPMFMDRLTGEVYVYGTNYTVIFPYSDFIINKLKFGDNLKLPIDIKEDEEYSLCINKVNDKTLTIQFLLITRPFYLQPSSYTNRFNLERYNDNIDELYKKFDTVLPIKFEYLETKELPYFIALNEKFNFCNFTYTVKNKKLDLDILLL